MGIYDRDYFRSQAGAAEFGRMRMLSVTAWLIIINSAVFFIDAALLGSRVSVPVDTGRIVMTGDGPARVMRPVAPLEAVGFFSAYTAIRELQVWRFFTFQFLHANFQHLLFNMLGLYFFGQMMETYLGRQRFLTFYLLCGVAGVAAYLILWALGFLVSTAYVPLVGASAGIFGILAAAAQVAPRATVMLMFPPMPVDLRTWAYILLGLATLTVLFAGPNAGGEAAHLGGALLGIVMIRSPSLLAMLGPKQRMRMTYR
jgi:membrane associated rhomboid family serine protease